MQQETHIGNRYELIDKLGQGGMGVVYKAYDRLEQQHVALKRLLIAADQLQFGSRAGTDNFDRLRLKLAHEFSILATLRHPHILSVLDFGFDEDQHPFYTMTLLEGGTDVRSYADDRPIEEQVELLAQMLQALHYLHRRGILHRDLKPDNVFVTADGQVKVMDFGLARKDTGASQESKDGKLTGTLLYMAPELFGGQKASVASDLYAVGVMAYEILEGHYPYPHDHIGELLAKIMYDTPSFASLPIDLAILLEGLLDKDPIGRPASAYDVLVELYAAHGKAGPDENQAIRESFLQASTFVGREAELNQLTDALNTLDTQNAFFLIGGESGVGKSRLLDELRIQALVKGATVLRGQAVTGGGLPFQAWREPLRRLLLQVDVDEFQLGVLKDIVPDMDQLLQREIAPAPTLEGRAYQERLVLAIVDVFRQATQPILLILDDLQWASESLLPLRQMLKVPEQLGQLMVVGAYRDDERPDLPDELPGMESQRLTRLSSAAVADLCQFMLGERVLASNIITQMERESEGNTFFMVEIARAIAQHAPHLQQIDLDNIPRNILTQGIKHLFDQRLAQMPAEYQPLLHTAAVSGRQIDEALLQHIYPDLDITNWLYLAEALAILDIRDNQWQFIHDKLRETILADMPDESRLALHRTIAEALETLYPDDNSYHAILLEHWQQVGNLDKTYQYLLPVVEQMIAIQGAYTTANGLLHNMLDRLPDDDARCIALWNWLASSELLLGNYSVSQSHCHHAQQLATTHGDRAGLATSLLKLANIARLQGDYARATDLYQQSLNIRQELGDQRTIASSLLGLGLVAHTQGDYARVTDLYQQGLAIYQELGDQYGMAGMLNNLGTVAEFQGDYARATDLYQQSLAIKRELGDQTGIGRSLANLGSVAEAQGDHAQATNLLQQAHAIFQEAGDQLSIGIILNHLGSIAINQEDYARATDRFQQSLAISQQLGHQFQIAFAFMCLGKVAFKQGTAQSSNWFQQGLSTAHRIKAVRLILWSVVGLAGVLAQRKQAERAARLIGLVQHHPAQDPNVREALDEVLPLLEAALAPDDLAAALEQGKQLDLETMVQELLAEFKPLSNTDTQELKKVE